MINTPMVEKHSYGYNKIDLTLNDGHILQKLYDSEINFSISCFWDAKIDWKLGDEMNGYKKEGCSKTVSLAIWDLGVEASILYPDSEFATYFKTLQC